jgi:translation initiation factor IF-2
MAEYRLAKVASELNRSAQVLAEFLNNSGFQVEPRPTTKISDEMYRALVEEFSADKAAREEANQLKSLKTPRPVSPEPVAPVSPAVEAEQPKEEPKIEAIVDPEPTVVKGPKVLGKIEIPSKGGKRKAAEPVQAKVEAKPEPVQAPEPVAPEPEVVVEVQKPAASAPKAPAADAPVEEETDEKVETKFEKLSGPKVLGKIALPNQERSGVKTLADAARDELREKRKRKRKTVEGEKVAVQDRIREQRQQEAPKPGQAAPGKTEVTQKSVNRNVQNTMGRMGSAGRTRGQKHKIKQRNKEDRNQQRREKQERQDAESKILKVTEFVTANDLAQLMNQPVTAIISACFTLGLMVSINQRLDAETIQIVADEYGYEIEFVDAESQIIAIEEEEDEPKDLKPRAPIVTVMGHVDHGKTSLLDYVRKENVIAGEAGGITQHIGAYEVTLQDKRRITFLDTPGHEAFTAMRARGAKVTDLAIIVIAADDSVMPQTREAIAHAQAAGVPMVFAINKIDKDGANPERIREQLAGMNILVEDWGGKFQCQEISAKKGLNIDKLLEKVLLEAEMMELTANPDRNAKGTVIEATQERGRGIVCTMLVQTGTLRVGDHMVAGPYYAKVRALFNERGTNIKEAPPSTPVKMLGFSETPTAGDIWVEFSEESAAKEVANKRQQLVREQGIRTQRHITLDEIGRRLSVGNFKELKLIVKGDVDGSVEALSDSLLKLSTEEIAVNVIHRGVGQITESDVLLASASDAIIVGFNVRPSAKAKQLAENEEIDIRAYSIIYKAIEEIKSAMEGLLSPEVVEKVIGNVEIREVFKISKVGSIAGCMVTDGHVDRNSMIRIIRDGVVIHTGSLASLKRYKDDVKEVKKGYECGLQIERFNDIEVGDYLEVYKEEEVQRKL